MDTTAKSAEKLPTEKIEIEPPELELKPKVEEEKKPKRGRPKKPEPITWEKVKVSEFGKMLDGIIANGLNQTVLKGCTKQLVPEKVTLGRAIYYTFCYYGLPMDHPIAFVILGTMSLTSEVLECLKTRPAKG
jgi:hypothetical protein